jgi:Tfp pilus assembly protein PilN
MSILTDHTAEVRPPDDAGFDMFASREYTPPRANLLPPEIAERLALRRVIAGMVAAVVVCGGIVGGLYSVTENGKAPAKAALVDAQTQHDGLVAQQAKLAPSQAAHQQVLTAKTSLEAAVGSEVLWSDQLNSLRSHLTDGVRLKDLSVTESVGTGSAASAAVTLPAGPANQPSSTVTSTAAAPATAIASLSMTGVAVSNYALADWMDTLATLHGWSAVYLSTSTAAGDSASGSSLVTFTITANITNAALSHRYTNGG